MGSSYEDIIGSSIFMFVIGPNGKEYNVHSAAISRLSKPLGVLINGDMCEAKEKCVKWPDVDEKTFVRFTQWAYTGNYVTEEPDILLHNSLIESPNSSQESLAVPDSEASETSLYSLSTAYFAQSPKNKFCRNGACKWYARRASTDSVQATCLACMDRYVATACASCGSVYTDCPRCGPLTTTPRNSCSNSSCYNRNYGTNTGQVKCPRCLTSYSTRKCARGCGSAMIDCVACAAENEKPVPVKKRGELAREFLDANGTIYSTSNSVFSPRQNTEGCEDYTGVFLCHAKLYVLADTYDIPALKQLSLHRLHATLKEFNLYPSRFNDIATLAKYVFANTVPEDKIRGMITLYYACIVEDAWKQDGLKSLIEEIPDFAFGLISKMSDRLA